MFLTVQLTSEQAKRNWLSQSAEQTWAISGLFSSRGRWQQARQKYCSRQQEVAASSVRHRGR